ncbi:hypothetical protein A11A3_06958 [Alcanivorax hongdengensis A-11-3]|uniref:Lipoprotein n=1 Tax=Alcanivorax hongdengensis A-11-3 TaxID=1177179 RepID=L0WEZ8_9GAMM|nr:hypothetical protein [Alcanivorax hongdengensis]EKF74742.1 hypothetical protein A11A3_06958 [Alcanivorax hongdengensis A-11-3]
MLRQPLPLLTLAIGLSLAACGGGGGGDNDTSNTDTTSNPPAETFTLGGTVTGLVNPGLTLENNGDDSLAVAGNSFVFDTPLSDGGDYAVTVAKPPRHQLCSTDNARGTMAGENVDDIRILCRSWRTDMKIEQGDGPAYDPQVAVDSDGNAIAVWEQHDGMMYSIWANTYTPGTGWGSAETIESGDKTASHPQITFVNDTGKAIAVWQQSDGAHRNIRANTYTPDSGWSTSSVLVEQDDAGDAYNPRITSDGAGHIIAVWYRIVDYSTATIQTNTYSAGSGWDAASLTLASFDISNSNSASSPKRPQIAADGAGNVIAIWRQYDGTRWNIHARTSTFSSGWSTPATLIEHGDDGDALAPQIAFDGDGNAIAVWAQDNASGTDVRYDIQANTYTPDGGWGTATRIEHDNDGNAGFPQIALDHAGHAIAVWVQNEGIHYNIRANTYTQENGWDTATLIEQDDDGDARRPRIAVDGDGHAIAVWHQNDGAHYNIRANTYTPKNGWDTATRIDHGDEGDALAPQIAFDDKGNATAVWYQDDGTRENIRANRFE